MFYGALTSCDRWWSPDEKGHQMSNESNSAGQHGQRNWNLTEQDFRKQGMEASRAQEAAAAAARERARQTGGSGS